MATQPKKTDTAENNGAERKPMPMPEGGWPPDEFTGQAGSFERDPYTGKRRRVEEPTEPQKPKAERKPAP